MYSGSAAAPLLWDVYETLTNTRIYFARHEKCKTKSSIMEQRRMVNSCDNFFFRRDVKYIAMRG